MNQAILLIDDAQPKKVYDMGTLLLYLTTVIIWGTTWFAITFQLGTVPVEWSLVYRFGLAAMILMIFCIATRRNLRFSRRSHLIFFGLGFFLFAINYYLNYIGVQHLTSGLVAVIFSLLTFMNIINGSLFLKRKLTLKNILAAAMGLAGIALVFSPEIKNIDLELTNDNGKINSVFIGIGVTLLATYFASLGNTLATVTRNIKAPVLQANAWGMAYGTILLIVFAIISGEPLVFDTSAPYVLSLLYLSVFGTVVAFSAYLLLIGRIGMEKAGYVAIMMPIIALLVSTFFESYSWTMPAFIGVALIVLGNIIVLIKDKSERASSPQNPQVEAVKV